MFITDTFAANTCDITFNSGVSSKDYEFISGYNDVLGSQIFLTYYDTALQLSADMLNTQLLRHPGGTVASLVYEYIQTLLNS